MTLGEVVNKYRKEHRMTMEEFAKKSGLSKGYISMLEANENPRSKKPIVPSLDTYRAVAIATGSDLNNLINITSDEFVSVGDLADAEDISYYNSQADEDMKRSEMELKQDSDSKGLSKDRLTEMLGEDDITERAGIGVVMVPIIGEVAAGMDIVAREDIKGFYPAPANMINKQEEYFYLIVDGDSMTPEINEGDLILVKKQNSLDSGDIGVFLLDKHEGVVKKVIYDRNRIELISVNPYYPPRVFVGPDVLRVYVIGKVMSSVRRYA